MEGLLKFLMVLVITYGIVKIIYWRKIDKIIYPR
jgi:hypothetical protein